MGWAATKREARRQAREAVASGFCDYTLIPPTGGMVIEHSCDKIIGIFYYPNLLEDMLTYSLAEISENTAMWLLGSCNYIKRDSTEEERVVALLKVWELYCGGTEKSEIMAIHNLQDNEFEVLANKEWNYILININDDEEINWLFSDTDIDFVND